MNDAMVEGKKLVKHYKNLGIAHVTNSQLSIGKYSVNLASQNYQLQAGGTAVSS